MIKWIDVKDKKSEQDCTAYVMNCRSGMDAFIVLYQKRYDIWKIYDPKAYHHPCVDVTHWVELPYPFITD